MPPRISVVAHVESNDSALVELVESLDAQSLSYRDFDVILLVLEGTVPLRRRLEQLAGRRPHVAIQPFEGHWLEALRSTSAAVGAPSVLPLSPHLGGGATRLHPDALRQVSDFFAANECDLLLARASWSSATTPIPWELRHDVAQTGQETARKLLSASTLAYGSEFFRTHGPLRDASDLAGIDASARIGILGTYPVVVRPSGADDPPLQGDDARGPRAHEVTASWRDGRILLAAKVADPDGDRKYLLSIRGPENGPEYWLPTAEDANAGWELDVRSAALGAPLPDGLFSVMGNLYAADGEPLARSPVSAIPLETGIVDGRPVVPASRKGKLVIDVGATHFAPVPSLEVDQVHITEDARGALFTARLPEMYTTGPADTHGAVTLGRLTLPAWLAAAEREVKLRFFVSGLAGESTLATRFGTAPAAPTGLNVVITGTGEIGVTPTPPPPPPPATPPKPIKKAAAAKPAPLMTRLRRAVPAPLEPMARRLSRNPLARRLYRRMTQR